MSTTYSAKAVIGISIPIEKIVKEVIHKTVPAFNHNYKLEDGILFDPQTGELLWEDETTVVFVDGFTREMLWGEGSISGFPILRGPSSELRKYANNYLPRDVVVAVTYVVSEYGVVSQHINFADGVFDILLAKKQLQEVLEPLGLWDENNFGLHAILFVS